MKTTCAIVGGGPAGMVAGLLLARAGIHVTVLEKYGDFRRDFRGNTVHPTTLRLLDELGLGDRFASLPHTKVHQAVVDHGGRSVTVVDFGRLRQPHPYIAMVPQWELLNLLAEAGQAEPTFTLRMRTEVTGLLRADDKISGVRYAGPDGPGELQADLTIGCGGRWSVARRAAGLIPREYPVDFDVWLFQLPHEHTADFSVLPRTAPGKAIMVVPREGYLQIAYAALKGTDEQLRARGLQAFRDDIAQLLPEAARSLEALASFDDVHHLDVRQNRLSRWHIDGLLCIGDAAHAMSPVGGVGINLAIQDAVAAATLLAEPLRLGRVCTRDLAAVHRRRALPAAVTQALQRVIHRRLVGPVLRGKRTDPPKVAMALLARFPWLAAVPAYLVGVGLRPEHAPDFARR